MSDTMRPLPYRELITRALAEYERRRSIFDIPEDHFYRPVSNLRYTPLLSASAASPLGPAAGPHTQLAQNILSSYLVGGRYFELKTVQILDELEVEKPCIDAEDEGYNVEWSSEFTLDKAYDEYLKGWFLLHLFESSFAPGAPIPSFLFNMSVGYDLAGIKTARMDRFINRLTDSGNEKLFQGYLAETEKIAKKVPLFEQFDPAQVSAKVCGSVTLSTMHGCPPNEIEAICHYLLTEKNLDTLVKLNPTLLGVDQVGDMFSALGYDTLSLNPESFEKDLQWTDAVPMLRRLSRVAEDTGRIFGVKLTNTLAVHNHRDILPGEEMYLSGRALYPLAIHLAAKVADEFEDSIPISFSAGVSSWNIEVIAKCGIRPITLATELLKPGGYGRMKELAKKLEQISYDRKTTGIDTALIKQAAAESLTTGVFGKKFRREHRATVSGLLPLFDCFIAPCIETCPIAQGVPEYVHLVGEGNYLDAFAVLYERNPLPFQTGYLCDQRCTESCTRMDWEGTVNIRDVKRIAAERGFHAFRQSESLKKRQAQSRGIKAAIVGGGPGGMAAASFLSREGFEVHIFEREAQLGGIIRYVLPDFRLPYDIVEKEVLLLQDLGVHFHLNQLRALSIDELRSHGFSHILVAIGAEVERSLDIAGSLSALSFLKVFKTSPKALKLGRSVAVVGAGDTAMDAARAALRCPGVEKVRIIYRRGIDEMPASEEEYRSAADEGIPFLFHRSPEEFGKEGSLRCRVMELGDVDESGRARPVPTETVEEFDVDTVIGAIGEDVDSAVLQLMHIDPKNPGSGVFLIGDAETGPSTIVQAIASARRATEQICLQAGGSRFIPFETAAENTGWLRQQRDRIIPTAHSEYDSDIADIEAKRCLGCRALCLKCVEVCPNRANTFIRSGLANAGLSDEYQIVHLDAFCNECGNCSTFCPWNGRPYIDKITVFSLEEDFLASANPGFFIDNGAGKLRLNAVQYPIDLDGSGSVVTPCDDKKTMAVVETIIRHYPYLLGPVEL